MTFLDAVDFHKINPAGTVVRCTSSKAGRDRYTITAWINLRYCKATAAHDGSVTTLRIGEFVVAE